MTLTPKQELFCIKYIETGNASEAYRQAYDAENMSTRSIKVEASRLINDPNITLTISRLKNEHNERHKFTVTQAFLEYEEARILAKENNQSSSMIAATKGKVALAGIEPPKNVKMDSLPIIRIVDMTGKR